MSRHADIAEAVKDVAAAWAVTNWVGALCERARVFDNAVKLVNAERPIVVAVMTAEITNDATQPRGSDFDVITINVVPLVRANSISNETLDPIDDNVEALRDHLRKFREVTVGDHAFEMFSTWTLETSYDHDLLSENELWACLLSAQYSVSVDTLPEVPPV